MPIPKHGWKPMDTAPQDGKPFIAIFPEYGMKDGRTAMQPVWWMCDSQGKSWGWKKFGSMDSTAHAEGWMWPHELLLCMAEMSMPEFAEAPQPAKALDFDL